MQMIDFIEEKARLVCPKVLFPESNNTQILRVAESAAKKRIAIPILLGDEDIIRALARENEISLQNIEILEIDDNLKSQLAEKFSAEHPEMTPKMVLRKLRDPLYQSAILVHFDIADSFIAGHEYTTGEVILAASTFVGKAEYTQTISSFNILTIPGFEGGENGSVIYTDVAVCVRPTSEQLADIAMLAADASSTIMGWTPKVAFLSYSTKGSAESDETERVVNALRILKEKRPDILADGELQLEVALSRKAAEKKMDNIGEVAGQANILVFPDINAGNTNIKAAKLYTNCNSIGPILTGFKKPVSDLSRTGSLEHQVGTVAAIAALCEKEKP